MPDQSIPCNHATAPIDEALLRSWIRGWALTRDAAPPVEAFGGFYVAVNWPDQKARYVFASITEEVCSLAQTITEPLVFLKVCCSAAALQAILPPRWAIQPQRYLMYHNGTMPVPGKELPEGYYCELLDSLPLPTVHLRTDDSIIAAKGHMVRVDDIAIYDRIETHPAHRRLGLGSQVMKALETIALRQGITRGVLVATAEGRALYETLGWKVITEYATAVIPAT